MNKQTGLMGLATRLVGCALVLGLALGMAGCGKNDEELIRTAVTDLMEAFKEPTEDNLKPLIENGEGVDSTLQEMEDYGIDLYEFLGHCFRHFDYSIDDVQIDGSTATVSLTLSNADLKKATDAVIEDITAHMDDYTDIILAEDGEQQFMQAYVQKLYDQLDASDEIVTNSATLTLTKENDEWTVDEDSMTEVISGMYGGVEL